ncbi:protein of unknown function [Pseudomonas sp. JV241A]|nr:protein of unknown function [Pseudomonas sp. JV241A]
MGAGLPRDEASTVSRGLGIAILNELDKPTTSSDKSQCRKCFLSDRSESYFRRRCSVVPCPSWT